MKAKEENKEITNSRKTPVQGLNILMVDDDEICLFIQQRVIELSGQSNTVQSASNGKIALEYLHRATAEARPLPDLILLDLQMPVMNGTEFMEAFRCADFPGKERIAIVLLTSSVWESDKEYALSLGVSDYLTKPFTVDVFKALLSSMYTRKNLPGGAVLYSQDTNNFRNQLS